MNYTLADILGVGVGFVLFALFAFAPGYTFGWLSDVFAFRRRRLATRIAAAVPLSVGLMPITAFLLWYCWLPLVWLVFGACGAACIVLLIRDWRAIGLHLSRAGWWVFSIAAGWVAIGTLSLIDLQFGNRLYFPFSTYDHLTRAAFTAAIARDGIPAHNPFFFAGQPGILRYHYFWFIPAALVDRLGGSLVTARMGVIDGILWAGLALMATIPLYLRFFQPRAGEQIERRTLIAVSLLGITGFDILPVALIDFKLHVFIPTIEWWNNQISAWITTMLWVPHTLAALTAGLMGFLLVWEAAREQRKWARFAALAVSGLAFASSVGSNIYVGGTIGVGCMLWIVIALVKRWWRHAWMLISAGVLGSALLMPWILMILHSSHGAYNGTGPKGSLPFSLTVRAFPMFDVMVRPSSQIKLLMLNAAILPLNYFLEYGFFFLVGFYCIRRICRKGFRDQAEWAAVALMAASFFISTFVTSTIIKADDLQWRGPLVIQFILLIWAAELWHEGTIGFGIPRPSKAGANRKFAPLLVTVGLILGALGSGYELCLQRTFPILSDMYPHHKYAWLSPDQQLGRRTFALRSTYQQLDHILPAGAVVQANPRHGVGNAMAEYYSGRQMVADSGACGTVFGGSEKFCNDVILPQLKPLFNDRHPVTIAQVQKVCREFSISALLFEDTDPVWKDKSSWIWHVQPLIHNDFARVIQCGNIAPSGLNPRAEQ